MKRSQDAWQTTLSTGPGPSFCAGCGKLPPQGPGGQACPYCGDRLIPQGFCPVCEGYLRLPVGTACPKHDLVLEARAPVRPQLDDAGKPLKWVTVGQFSDSMAAEAPRIRLEAEGIPTFVEGERMGSRSMYHVATGGVKLKVPDSLATDARIILSQTWSATAAELDIEESPDEDVDESRREIEAQRLSVFEGFLNEIIIGSVVIVPVVALLYMLIRSISGR